jgi:splicing factor 3B subunit 4
MSHVEERNHENTVFVGDMEQSVDEALLWELMIQVGPVVSVYIPRDKLTKDHNRFGFVEFQSEADVDYACKVMNGVPLYNQPIRVNRSGRDRKLFDIGANLFIGNLDPEVDERHITETFKSFGNMIGPARVARDDTSGVSRGYAFVYYDSFEAADAAIAAMNGTFFGGRRINVNFSFKKDKPGERHGDPAERLLAAKNPITKMRQEIQAAAPHTSSQHASSQHASSHSAPPHPTAPLPSHAPPAATPPPFGLGPPGAVPMPYPPYGSPPPFMPQNAGPPPPFAYAPMYGMPPPFQQPPPNAYPPPAYNGQQYSQYPR